MFSSVPCVIMRARLSLLVMLNTKFEAQHPAAFFISSYFLSRRFIFSLESKPEISKIYFSISEN
jgi:hypothetical protein